ncbi:MAG: alkaline phosphatase family protein [bacterium]
MSKRVIMVGIDGCHQATLYGLIDRGEAPFFTKLAKNGTRVAKAVTMFPSTTTCCCSTLYTGCWYKNHGILNNEWVDRFATPVRAHTYIAGMRYALESLDRKLFGWPTILLPSANKGGAVNNDFQTPTVYEELTAAGKTSYALFNYISRGATRWVRQSHADMLRFAYVEKREKPYQIYERYLVTRAIQHTKRKPADLLSIYFGCNDGNSHRHGVEGQLGYLRDFIDPELARLAAALERLCTGDEIYWAITADHGQTTITKKENSVWATDFFPIFTKAGFERIERGLSDNEELDSLDAIVSLGTGASLGFYARNRKTRDWKIFPDFEADLVPALNNFLKASAKAEPFSDWKFPGCVDFLLTRKTFEEPYRIYANEPPFDGVGKLVELEKYFSDRAGDGYVKPVERIRGIDHPKGPDIVLLLNYRDQFNVNEAESFHPGQHGSLFAGDSLVPMIFSGPGVRREEIPEAFTIDYSPTAASILGVEMPKADGKPLPIFD